LGAGKCGHKALIREILSSAVPARLIDLMVLLLFGLVIAKTNWLFLKIIIV